MAKEQSWGSNVSLATVADELALQSMVRRQIIMQENL